MRRFFVVGLPLIGLCSCATAVDDTSGTYVPDGSSAVDSTSVVDSAIPTDTGSAPPDTTTAADTGELPTDSAATDSSSPDTADAVAFDTYVADTKVDASVTDTFVADTYVADTKADTFVADTFVADTKADTFIADTSVTDTYVADTAPADGGACSGTIVDWNWSSGSGPTTLVTSSTSSLWAVGPATGYGPKDGLNYLATNPAGYYVNNMNEWVRLPTINLSAWSTCKLKVSVEVWRYCEGISSNVDGGNLQYTTAADPAAATDWKVLDGTSMGYDGPLTTTSCGTSCSLYNQNTWAGRSTPYAKSGTFTSTAAMGSSLAFRFTFHSDGSLASYDVLYVKSLRVEAVP